MAGQCVVCHDKEADHRCIQCHKPVCDDDAFKSDLGVFCGRECASAYRSYQDQNARGKARGGTFKIVVILAIIAVLIVLAWRQGWGPFGSEGVDDVQGPAGEAPAELPEAPAFE